MINVNRPLTTTLPAHQGMPRWSHTGEISPHLQKHLLSTVAGGSYAGMQTQCCLIFQVFKRSLTFRFLFEIHLLENFGNQFKKL